MMNYIGDFYLSALKLIIEYSFENSKRIPGTKILKKTILNNFDSTKSFP
jgi:hypothetical protein